MNEETVESITHDYEKVSAEVDEREAAVKNAHNAAVDRLTFERKELEKQAEAKDTSLKLQLELELCAYNGVLLKLGNDRQAARTTADARLQALLQK